METANTVIYLENYIKSLETIPADVQQNIRSMGDLHRLAESVWQEIKTEEADYLQVMIAGKASFERRQEHISKMNELRKKAEKCRDEEDRLIKQTYETVDQHVLKLESELARFEVEINGTGATSSSPPPPNPVPQPVTKPRRGRKGKKKATDTEEKGSNKGAVPMPAVKKTKSEIVTTADPNGPICCTCRQVSYGEMIGCDNPECAIEWFHIYCVGLDLSSLPKEEEKWYCQACQPARNEVMIKTENADINA